MLGVWGVLLPFASLALACDALQILWFSDIHLDPSYDPRFGHKCYCHATTDPSCTAGSRNNTYGQEGCDAPEVLLDAAISAAQAIVPNPDAVVVSGDYVCHGTTDVDLALSIVESATRKLQSAFPNATALHHPIISVIGNNDVVPDYTLNTTAPNAFLERLARALHMPNDTRQYSEFVSGGFFRTDLSPTVSVLALNTIPYSVEHTPPTPASAAADPLGQFQWLRDSLRNISSEGRRAVLVGHIPVGIDTYAFERLWQDRYTTEFLEILRGELGDVVGCQMFAHEHKSEVRVGMGSSVMWGLSSVSPVYRNNPTFGVVTLSDDAAPSLFVTHSANLTAHDNQLPNAPGLDFALDFDTQRRLGLASLTADAVAALADAMLTNDTLFGLYFSHRVASWPGTAECAPKERVQLMCAIKHPEHDAFQQCVADNWNGGGGGDDGDGDGVAGWVWPVVGAGALGAAAVLGLALWLGVRRRALPSHRQRVQRDAEDRYELAREPEG